MQLKMQQPASPGEAFAPNSFDSQIGTTIPVNDGDGGTTEGTIVAAEVADNGNSVELSIDIPDDSALARRLSVGVAGNFSLR